MMISLPNLHHLAVIKYIYGSTPKLVMENRRRLEKSFSIGRLTPSNESGTGIFLYVGFRPLTIILLFDVLIKSWLLYLCIYASLSHFLFFALGVVLFFAWMGIGLGVRLMKQKSIQRIFTTDKPYSFVEYSTSE